MSLVVPAVLPSTKSDFEESLRRILASPDVSRIQIDVVDGRLASPACWPYTAPGDLARMRSEGYVLPRAGQVEYEIDLMTLDALEAAETWLALGASRLTFHVESVVGKPDFFETAHGRYGGASVVSFGLAVNVTTDLRPLTPLAACVSYLQCMGIAKIGRQGEAFDPRALEQIRRLHQTFPGLPIQVDGGVTLAGAPAILAAGASTLVAGSAILEAKDPVVAIASFEALANPFGV